MIFLLGRLQSDSCRFCFQMFIRKLSVSLYSDANKLKRFCLCIQLRWWIDWEQQPFYECYIKQTGNPMDRRILDIRFTWIIPMIKTNFWSLELAEVAKLGCTNVRHVSNLIVTFHKSKSASWIINRQVQSQHQNCLGHTFVLESCVFGNEWHDVGRNPLCWRQNNPVTFCVARQPWRQETAQAQENMFVSC